MMAGLLMKWNWACLLLFLFGSVAAAEDASFVSEFTISSGNGYQPQMSDDYTCVALPAPTGYVTSFVPTSHADRVHHMILEGCDMPGWPQGTQPGQVWSNCYSHCAGVGHIMYAWARNAPALTLPKDVAFSVGQPHDGVKYIVLQVHYAQQLLGNVSDFTSVTLKMQPNPPIYIASVYLFMGFQMQETCKYNGHRAIHPFAFRTHTHGLGTVVSAYYVRNKQYTLIGKRNPQWPQMFESIKTNMTIEPGDWLSSVCVYDTMHMNTTTQVGATGHDEMCNFYMMFYRPLADPDPFAANPYCTGDIVESPELREIAAGYPKEGTTLLPEKPELEETAHQSSVQFGYSIHTPGISVSNLGDGPRRQARQTRRRGGGGRYRPRRPLEDESDYHDAYDAEYPQARGHAAYEDYGDGGGARRDRPRPRVRTTSTTQLPTTTTPQLPDGRLCAGCMIERNCLSQIGSVTFGQIGGLALSPVTGHLFMFHRGDRVWDASTFDYANRLRNRKEVAVDPVVEIQFDDKNQAKLVTSWGSDVFYMPHGIHVDSSGAVWLTDVGLHQVLKYKPDAKGVLQLSLTLGVRFQPGTDVRSFCKPAAVTTTPDGSVFVADGYCNSRVVKFSADGKYVSQFGKAYNGQPPNPPLDVFQLPHDITHDPKRSQLYVSDRQNGRVVVYGMDGKPKTQIKLPNDFSTVYSASYAADSIFLAPGEPPLSDASAPIRAFAVNADTNHVAYSFTPTTQNLTRPHVLRVDSAGRFIYIGEIAQTGLVWRLEVSREQHEYKMHGMGGHHGHQHMPDMHKDAPTKTAAEPKADHPHMNMAPSAQPDASKQPISQSPPVVDAAPSASAASKPAESSNQLKTMPESAGWPIWQALVLAVVLAAVCAGIACCLKGKSGGRNNRRNFDLSSAFRNASLSRNQVDRNGFKPLRTDDVEGLDSSSDSEFEDTLYTNGKKAKRPT